MTTSVNGNGGAREEILANIRKSLRREGALESTIQEGLRMRMHAYGAHVQPELGDDPQAVFVKKLRAAGCMVSEAQGTGDIADLVLDYLREHAPTQNMVTSADPLIGDIKWPKSIEAVQRVAQPEDHTSVTSAVCGVAETGTLVLVSGQRTPTTLNFLPENHIVIVRKTQILSHFEEAWQLLRAQYPQWIRTVNLISGPSKTADVEQTIQMGVHGPRRLFIVLVG